MTKRWEASARSPTDSSPSTTMVVNPVAAFPSPVRPEGGTVFAGRTGKQTLNWQDLLAVAVLALIAGYITSPLWLNLDQQLREAPQDQAFFEWMFAHGARVLSEGVSPFFSDRMNYPFGVNIMANTSILAISLPMTPVTLVFGPHIAFNLFSTLSLALTGISWYLLFSRQLVVSRLAALVGALFCAFSPGMVSQAAGHPNITFQALVPLLILFALRLRQPGHTARNGLILGGLVVWQAFINLEVLFMTVTGVGLFCVIMAIARRRDHPGEIKTFVRGLSFAAALAVTVLAYPLYRQFFGAQSYDGLPPGIHNYGADIGSFVAYSSRSIAGSSSIAKRLAQNPVEENSFFGLGLVISFVGLVFWLRRTATVAVLGGLALLFALFSLGPHIILLHREMHFPGPWALFDNVPVLNSLVPTRWALAITPIIGIVLAFGCHKGIELVNARGKNYRLVRKAMIFAAIIALLPLVPQPLRTKPMSPTPTFVTSGAWKKYIDDNHTLVTLPFTDAGYTDPLRWSAITGQDMRIAGAYALLPTHNRLKPNDHTATFFPPARPTITLMASIRKGKPAPIIDESRRAAALADLRYWKAGAVLLAPQDHDGEMLKNMTALLHLAPVWIDGVWIWDVQRLVP